MRRLLISIVLALVIGGAIGTLMTRDPGYVLVSYAGSSLETSLWFAVAALIVAYFALRGLIALVGTLLRGGSGIRTWRESRRSRNAQERTQRGLLLAGEGDWAAARKTLSAVAARADTPLVNYLVAARAANEMGDTPARDELLDRAAATDPSVYLTVAIARAEMQLAVHELDAAAATLNEARSANAGNRRLLELLVACYEAQQHWAGLLMLADELRQQRVWSADALATAQRRWWTGYFRHRTRSLAGSDDQLASLWDRAGKELHHDPDIVLAQAEAQLAENDADAAEATLREALDAAWSGVLVEQYSRVHSSDVVRQFEHARRWLKKHPDDAALHLTVGRLALYCADRDAAREHFERSVALHPSVAACGELGRLYAAAGEHARAAELLADAAAMHGDVVPLTAAHS
jgi:HemY protein